MLRGSPRDGGLRRGVLHRRQPYIVVFKALEKRVLQNAYAQEGRSMQGRRHMRVTRRRRGRAGRILYLDEAEMLYLISFQISTWLYLYLDEAEILYRAEISHS